MSLKRFKGHASNITDPVLMTFFRPFLDRSVIESDTINTPDACNDFRSGDNRRKQSDYCDVSGVFGAVCMHGFIYGLKDMSKGESLDYSRDFINQLRSDMPNCRLVITYDIFCKIRTNNGNKVDSGFIPEMHSYNHNDACQSRCSPKRMLGIGVEDGEDCERFWSFINYAGSYTSVMRNENRTDVLSIICEAYNECRFYRIVDRLKKDANKCSDNLNLIFSEDLTLESIEVYDHVRQEILMSNETLLLSVHQSSQDPKSAFMKSIRESIRLLHMKKEKLKKKGI